MSTPNQRAVLLEDVERKARADLAAGNGAAAVDWVFRHARAVVRATEAEQAWKAYDQDRMRLTLDVYDGFKGLKMAKPDDFDALVTATASLHSAAADLGEARAIEVACAHVLRLLERMPVRQQASAPRQEPAARPQQQRPKAA